MQYHSLALWHQETPRHNLGKVRETMLRVLSTVTRMIRASGIIEEHIFKWLRDLGEMELMQSELYFQLKKARNSYITFLEKEPDAGGTGTIKHLTKVAAKIDEFLENTD